MEDFLVNLNLIYILDKNLMIKFSFYNYKNNILTQIHKLNLLIIKF